MIIKQVLARLELAGKDPTKYMNAIERKIYEKNNKADTLVKEKSKAKTTKEREKIADQLRKLRTEIKALNQKNKDGYSNENLERDEDNKRELRKGRKGIIRNWERTDN